MYDGYADVTGHAINEINKYIIVFAQIVIIRHSSLLYFYEF